jgi:hypothetical protein
MLTLQGVRLTLIFLVVVCCHAAARCMGLDATIEYVSMKFHFTSGSHSLLIRLQHLLVHVLKNLQHQLNVHYQAIASILREILSNHHT